MSVSKKILLNIRIRNETDPLVISCPSFSVARSMADLIDGYHRLAHNSLKTVWQNCLSMFITFCRAQNVTCFFSFEQMQSNKHKQDK